jgi:hypothetical protein
MDNPSKEEQMNGRGSLPAAGMVTMVGLVMAAVGIAIQIVSGVDAYPTIPPGLVILLVAAGLIALGGRRRWVPLLGAAVALFILFGAVVAPGTADRLARPGEAGAFAGTVIQVLGLVVALLAGIGAAFRGARRPASGG